MLNKHSELSQIREFTQSDDFAVLTRFIEKNYLVAGLFENIPSHGAPSKLRFAK